MDGDAAVDKMLASLKAVQRLDEAAAREAAPLVEAAAKALAAAGIDPMTGAAWAPLVSGGRAGVNAARDVSAVAIGNVVQVIVGGDHVYLHLGRGKTQAARPIIPAPGSPIPPSYAKALAEGARRAWAKANGGAA